MVPCVSVLTWFDCTLWLTLIRQLNFRAHPKTSLTFYVRTNEFLTVLDGIRGLQMSNRDFPLCKKQGEVKRTESFNVQNKLLHFPAKMRAC